MKPNWKDAPVWANWLAMDGNGLWCWFELKPEFDEKDDVWCLSSEIECDSEYEYASGYPDESGIDWDHAFDTLEARP